MRCPAAGPVTMPPTGRATSIWASDLQPTPSTESRAAGPLRTAEGLELATVETCFGKERAERLLRQAEPFMRVGELCLAAGRLAIPAEKFLVSDAVIGALFEADD